MTAAAGRLAARFIIWEMDRCRQHCEYMYAHGEPNTYIHTYIHSAVGLHQLGPHTYIWRLAHTNSAHNFPKRLNRTPRQHPRRPSQARVNRPEAQVNPGQHSQCRSERPLGPRQPPGPKSSQSQHPKSPSQSSHGPDQPQVNSLDELEQYIIRM